MKSIICFFKGHIPYYTGIGWISFHKFQIAELSCHRCKGVIMSHRLPLAGNNRIWNTEELNEICEYKEDAHEHA